MHEDGNALTGRWLGVGASQTGMQVGRIATTGGLPDGLEGRLKEEVTALVTAAFLDDAVDGLRVDAAADDSWLSIRIAKQAETPAAFSVRRAELSQSATGHRELVLEIALDERAE